MSDISIFNIGEHKDEVNAGMFREQTVSNLFDPKLKDAKDYKVFIIRPLPYVNNPVQSMVTKNFYALRDAAGTIMFDSRTTFNRPAEQHYEFCPVSDLWMKLRNATDPNVQNLTKNLRQQRACYAYVQIVKFPGEEALEGQIKVMRLPAELVKLFGKMAKPDENEIKLGAVPVQPFDIMRGKNIKCTVTGKVVDGTVMREWKCEATGEVCDAQFPIGPNNAMTPVSQLQQDAVIAYFKEQQTVDMFVQYGYKEPTIDTKIRVKAVLQAIVNGIPGISDIVATYFPEIRSAMPLDQNANTAPANPVPANPAPANPIPAPAMTTIEAGDPMQAPAPANSAPANPVPGAPVLP